LDENPLGFSDQTHTSFPSLDARACQPSQEACVVLLKYSKPFSPHPLFKAFVEQSDKNRK
jgi:hypothetical protein